MTDDMGLQEAGAGKAPAKKGSKLKSAKLWVTLWAVAIVSYIVLANRAAFLDVAKYLCAVPVCYIGANVAQKKIFADKMPE